MRHRLLLLVASGLCAACPHDLRRPARDRAAADRDVHPADLAADEARPRPDFPRTPDRGCPSPCVTTFAGSCEHGGFDDGDALYARFQDPTELIIEPSGSLLVADTSNRRVRRVTVPDGRVSTVAGSGAPGCDDGAPDKATFEKPHGLAVDDQGAILISDHFCNTIRRVYGDSVTTIAGKAYEGGVVNGIGTAARFFAPQPLLLDSAGALLVGEWGNCLIRRVNLTSYEVSTLAGTGTWHADGPYLSAGFSYPTAMLRGSGDTVYVAEQHCLRVMAGGIVTTLAGSVFPGSTNGPPADARFSQPSAMVFVAPGVMLVADYGNSEIRRFDMVAQTVSTYAGFPGSAGYRDGSADLARFSYPWGMAVASSGTVYVADNGNHCIRMIR
jgi:large repetitive protein